MNTDFADHRGSDRRKSAESVFIRGLFFIFFMTYLLILTVYALAMIVFGIIASRHVRTSSDFFVAGRGLSAGLLASTFLAANIGAGSTVGAAGLGYRDGLSAFWWVGSAGIGSLILAFTVGPKIWRIARDHNLYTVGDYLEYRYNRSVRGLAALLLWFGSLAILAGQLIAIAWILNVTAGIDKPFGCLIGAAVATLYFTLGGLHGAVRVNVLQLVVKMVGFILALVYLLSVSGGWPKISSFENIVANPRSYLDFTGIGLYGVLGYIAMLAPSFVVSPGLLQKVFGAKDESAVKRGVGFNALGLLAFAVVPALLGIMTHLQFPDLPNRELALPTLLTQSLPLWLGGLLLGAIFAAELSASDAILFMLSTSLTKDLYQTFIRPQADDRHLMTVVRTAAVICGFLGAGLGILFETVISALSIFYTLLTAALLLPIVAGLYTRRVSARASIATIMTSVVVTFSIDRLAGGQGKLGLPSLVWGIGAGALVMFIFALVERKERESNH